MKKFFTIYFVLLAVFLSGAVFLGNVAREKIITSSAINTINAFRGVDGDNLDEKAKDYIIDRVASDDEVEVVEEEEKDYTIKTDLNTEEAETTDEGGIIEEVIKDVIKEKATEEITNTIDNYGD